MLYKLRISIKIIWIQQFSNIHRNLRCVELLSEYDTQIRILSQTLFLKRCLVFQQFYNSTVIIACAKNTFFYGHVCSI